jgi:hypothetical protein
VTGVSIRVVTELKFLFFSVLAVSAASSNLNGWRDFAHGSGMVIGRSVEVLALIENSKLIKGITDPGEVGPYHGDDLNDLKMEEKRRYLVYY